MKKILIAGGTGMIGNELMNQLLKKGYEIAVLSRGNTKKAQQIQYYHWDIQKKEIHPDALKGAAHIINLAGANLAVGRWTTARKKKIIQSRTDSTAFLIEEIQNRQTHLESFICSSAVGYYGMNTPESIFEEDHPPGNDFLANVCVAWEKALLPFNQMNIRSVSIRTGLVLSTKGGLLQKILPLASRGLNAAFGNGKQIYPWIHIEDIASVYVFALENQKINGAYNAAVSVHNQVNQKEFNNQLAEILGKRNRMPNIPGFLLKFGLGEMSNMLLSGSLISNKKIEDEGFELKYTDLKPALKDLMNRGN